MSPIIEFKDDGDKIVEPVKEKEVKKMPIVKKPVKKPLSKDKPPLDRMPKPPVRKSSKIIGREGNDLVLNMPGNVWFFASVDLAWKPLPLDQSSCLTHLALPTKDIFDNG